MLPRFREAILALGMLGLAASSIEAQHLPVRTYTTADGLAHNLIFRIVRDSRGYLWFCTREGLSRFDGYRFTNYTGDQGLRGDVTDFVETRSHAYWIATVDGLYRFNPDNSRSRNPAGPMFAAYHPSAPARFITKLYEDRQGTLWVGTSAGVYTLEESNGHVTFDFVDLGMPKTADDPMVESILEDRQGALWVGARSGLYRRARDGSVQRYVTRHGLPDPRVKALLEDREGRLWVGTPRGLCLLVPHPDPGAIAVARVYAGADFGLSSDDTFALLQSSDGHVWVATSAGLAELMPGSRGSAVAFRTYSRSQGLNYLDLMSLAEDSAGNVWIGATGGAMKLTRNGFVTYTETGGLLSIFAGDAGELYFVGERPDTTPFLIRYGEKSLSTVQPNFHPLIRPRGDLGWNQYGLQDRAGEWWLPTGQGLYRFPRVRRFEQLADTPPRAIYTSKDGLVADAVWRIYEDSRGDIWISSFSQTAVGLARWDRMTGTIHRYTKADGLPPGERADAFGEDASGNIWIGLGTALARYRAGGFALFTAADGSPPSRINALHLDDAGRLWVATDASGLTRIDNPNAGHPSFVAYTAANGLSSNRVCCITSDQAGRIYAFTSRALDRLDVATGRLRHYTTNDGLVGDVPTAAFRDRNGTLWFGTLAGVSRLTPGPDSTTPPPPILISGLRIAGERRSLSELGEADVSPIRLGPSDNQIQIDFVALGFGAGEQLRYQYKLEGADGRWSAFSDQRSVNYAHLSSGTYRFLVRAVTSDGMMSQSPASVAFTILPPVWLRWWFVTAAALLATAAAVALDRYRVARLLEVADMRTRIAIDLHDDIGANLAKIAILSEVARQRRPGQEGKGDGALSSIARISRESVASMSDIVWAINPKRDHLIDLVRRMRREAEDLCAARDIMLTFHAPEEERDLRLGVDIRRDLFLIFKEAINNSARHSRCQRITIDLEVTAPWLTLRVADDGSGFDPARSGDGHGLVNMTQRAKTLGGELTIRTGVNAGTSIHLRAPFARARRRPAGKHAGRPV
ncbi:MAG TPA: two-component regulator propeller domain-containing protein [Vicinamibacterales bacterium]|nr:two-component regulator propeller domain-containing protein [Vicinamibacterales bacterium]